MLKVVHLLVGCVFFFSLGISGSSFLKKTDEKTTQLNKSDKLNEPFDSAHEAQNISHYNHGQLTHIGLETVSFYCPSYSTSYTSSNTYNYATCSFTACGGNWIYISGCSACSGDQYLSLYSNSYSYAVASSDDGCGLCSYISYYVSGSSSSCQTFTIREGCLGSSSCSGTVYVQGSYNGRTGGSTVNNAYPTYSPNYYPTYDDDYDPVVLSVGAIVGIVISILVFCGGSITLCVLCCMYNKNKNTVVLVPSTQPVPQTMLTQPQGMMAPVGYAAVPSPGGPAEYGTVANFTLPNGQVVQAGNPQQQQAPQPQAQQQFSPWDKGQNQAGIQMMPQGQQQQQPPLANAYPVQQTTDVRYGP